MDVGGGMARSAMAPDALRDADVYLSRRGTGRPIGASRTIVFGQESLCQLRTSTVRTVRTDYSTPQAVRLALFRTRARSVQLPTVS